MYQLEQIINVRLIDSIISEKFHFKLEFLNFALNENCLQKKFYIWTRNNEHIYTKYLVVEKLTENLVSETPNSI